MLFSFKHFFKEKIFLATFLSIPMRKVVPYWGDASLGTSPSDIPHVLRNITHVLTTFGF